MSSTSNSRPARCNIKPWWRPSWRKWRTISWFYLVPAAIASLLINMGFLGAMFLLSSPDGRPNTDRVNTMITAVKAEAALPVSEPENQSNDPYLTPSTDIDPAAMDVDADISFNNKNQAEVNVPGLEKPDEKVGIERGAPDASPFSIPAPQGLGGFGQGGTLEDALAGKLDALGAAGGYGMQGLPPAPGSFEGRSGAAKEAALREGGGTTESEAAVSRGLYFLAKMQQADGGWRLNSRSFSVLEKDKSLRTVNIPDAGQYNKQFHNDNDVAATALALLPFFAAGKTHKESKDNPFDKPIEKALAFLLRRQDKRTGSFGGSMYAHGLATIAICECYGLTKDPLLKRPAQSALDFIVSAQHAGGGWRYFPGEPGDTSVVGWQVMALKSGQLARLDVPESTINKAIQYLDNACNPKNEGYGYVGRGSTPTMSAVALLCRQYIQFWGPNNPRMITAIERNIKPVPPGAKKDIYYYYYATQVMHHFGGESWKNWNEKDARPPGRHPSQGRRPGRQLGFTRRRSRLPRRPTHANFSQPADAGSVLSSFAAVQAAMMHPKNLLRRAARIIWLFLF